ncbi:MAG: PP2C family protein-serine/threonine phosphatase [Thermoanaerobaculia bacterium]
MTSTRRRLVMIWLSSFATIVAAGWIENVLDGLHLRFLPLDWIVFLSWVVFFALSLWLITVAVRFVLRKLFWRVGRRLALSYFLIGVLPFIFFAILLAISGYLMAAILSQATFRNERQVQLQRLDQWNLEYALTGTKPGTGLPSLEIYDSSDGSIATLPEWLRQSSFVGLATRNSQALFVSARRYERDDASRSIVLVQPMDEAWTSALEQRTGMFTAASKVQAEGNEPGTGQIVIGDSREVNFQLDDEQIAPFFRQAWGRGVIWGDLIPSIVDWRTGDPQEENAYLVLFANPWRNLLDVYFGSPTYVNAIIGTIGTIAGMMAMVYLLASVLAAGLIFSISRAVNRIDKGTRAVERGDFSYRIQMKRNSQLGELAGSFDHMVESISSLLLRVAEQERLQSEISIAAEIQRNLLPKQGPAYAGISFSAHFEPTASIGGDYYDLFNLDKTKLAVTIGDVSGHGLSTGIVMAMVKAAITTLVEQGADEHSLFRRLNELVVRSTEKRTFMTLGFTIFDLKYKTVRHTNAGHLYPYLLRDGEPPRPIEAPSFPLGIKEGVRPRTVELPLQERDTFVYLSDGIVEASNENDDPFGFDNLERLLVHLAGASPDQIRDTILEAVADHAGTRVADDDRTIMVLKFDRIQENFDAIDGVG